MGVIFINKLLKLVTQHEEAVAPKPPEASQSSVGIIGVMTEAARANYTEVFSKDHYQPICMTYHDLPDWRYELIPGTGRYQQIRDRLWEDARKLKKAGIAKLTSAVLEYEPLVDEIASDLNLGVFRLSEVLAKNCSSLPSPRAIGLVGLTNDCGSESILGQAIKRYKTKQLGVKMASTFDTVQDLTDEKLLDYYAEIADELDRDREISIVILSCPELYPLLARLRLHLSQRVPQDSRTNRKVVVWNTVSEHEYALRVAGLLNKP